MTSVPVLRPKLPTSEKLLPYLREIDGSRWYTNWGPLCVRLERRLAEWLKVKPEQLVLVSNATVGLSLALKAQGVKAGDEVLMPSWSFVATAASVTSMGALPHFEDVGLDSWELTVKTAENAAASRRIRGVIPVASFGAPIDSKAWDAFSYLTKVPVAIDAAASIDSLACRANGFAPVAAPTVISLHATKVFGMGEGGLIVSTNEKLIHDIRRLANFGFLGSRSALSDGGNYKISEYAAAVGNAELDAWEEKRAEWKRVAQDYFHLSKEIGLSSSIKMRPSSENPSWISSYMHVQFATHEERERAQSALKAAGVETRLWWNTGMHNEPAYLEYSRSELPNTDRIAKTMLGLPCYTDLETSQIRRVIEALKQA